MMNLNDLFVSPPNLDNSIASEILLTPEQIADIFEGKMKDPYYKTRVDLSNAIRLHSVADKNLVRALLKEKYPSEPEQITNYKLDNWKPITKTFFQKIVSTIAKFQKAEDFEIIYENNTVRDYCEQDIEDYGSVYNWFFTIGVHAMLQEPNGVVLVAPRLTAKTESEEPPAPLLHVFTAANVIYKTKNFALLKAPEGDTTYYYVDTRVIVLIEIEPEALYNYTRRAKEINYTLLYEHNFATLPLITLGGLPYSLDAPGIYESLIAGVTPFWNQALLDFSELIAGIKQHVFPDKWRYLSGVCKECNGSGKLTITDRGKKTTAICHACKGSGDPPTGMFAEILIRQNSGLEDKPPIPPIGYVKKDFEPIEFLERHYKKLIYEGLSAINMEFLTDTPLNQSGRAKEMDRMESNAFLSLVARHSIENILTPCYVFIAMWLFPGTDFKTAKRVLAPRITIPVQFDYLMGTADENIKNAKEAGVSGGVFAELEKRYINAKFDNFIYEKTYLLLVNTLDPLRGYNVDEKVELYNNGCITQLDLVCSANISRIIQKALETTYGFSFANKKYEDQMKFVYAEGKKILKNIDSDITKQRDKYVLPSDSALLSDNKQGDQATLSFDE